MIHYHGTRIAMSDAAAALVLSGRHALVSFADPSQLGIVAEVCQSFVFDNGAFSAWRGGSPITDWASYYAWVGEWVRHPGFDWAIIPDVIDGDEEANDALVRTWPHGNHGVPVWHLHESLARLDRLTREWPRVALGSSGEWGDPGTPKWWLRMTEVMRIACDGGKPRAKLHGLRMLNPEVFSRIPFASADSTNVGRNAGNEGRWQGEYAPASLAARGVVLAERIESVQSAAVWVAPPTQTDLFGRIA